MDVGLTSRHEWGWDWRLHQRTKNKSIQRKWEDGWHWCQTFWEVWNSTRIGTEYWNIEPSIGTFYICHWQCPSRGLPWFTEWLMDHDQVARWPICPDSRCPNIWITWIQVRKRRKGTNEFQTNPMTLAHLRCARVSARKKKPYHTTVFKDPETLVLLGVLIAGRLTGLTVFFRKHAIR